ncbi:MAG: DUF1707 domain-containing protein [Nocardioides sp.]
MSSPVPWHDFSADPRRPESARLRASDADRVVVLAALGDAYADGRLTREEYDERSTEAGLAKTLGDLPPLLSDLVPATSARVRVKSPEALHAQATLAYEARRRRLLLAMLVPSLICTVVWFVSGFGPQGWQLPFPWPLYVVVGTGIAPLRALVQREDFISAQRQLLETRQRKAIEKGAPDFGAQP